MTELLVQPYRDGSLQRVDAFYPLLSSYPNLEWVVPDLRVAEYGGSYPGNAWIKDAQRPTSRDSDKVTRHRDGCERPDQSLG